MNGAFSIHLLEIFAYLFPGCAVLFGCCWLYWREETLKITQDASAISVFMLLVGGYIMGHVIASGSYTIVRRIRRSKHLKNQASEEAHLPFMERMHLHLEKRYGEEILKEQRFYYCLRIVAEHMPASNSTYDRLFALTLFTRNMTLVAFLLFCMLLTRSEWGYAAVAMIVSIVFYNRYKVMDIAAIGMLYRAAHQFLIEQEHKQDQ